MIFRKKYDIERFWCPPDGVVGLDESGFLRDRDTFTVWMREPDSVPFEYIEDVPVLALLGEPGTGKSQWFQDVRAKVGECLRQKGHQDLWIDLGLYDSASDVIDAVFQNEKFAEWINGKHCLHVFLDSFDECHSRVDVLPKRLLSELSRQPVERLCLRILCRTSEWPQSLEEGLRKLWNERLHVRVTPAQGDVLSGVSPANPPVSLVQLFEMTPFRRTDFDEIVCGEGIEPESFLNEIQSRNLAPFANRPQSLAFLIRIYRATGQFPSNQVELYHEGCRELCREANSERTDGHLTGNFSADELLAVAERMAAVTVFCNRNSILPDESRADQASPGDISLRDVCHGVEKVAGREVEVRFETIRETLNTGLFTGRAGGRMGWAHQTYAEFLAARYLCRNDVPIDQMTTLVQHPGWSVGRIPPQLCETASWLSLMNKDFSERLMQIDPEVLLLKIQHTDSGALQTDFKERLVGRLLKLLDEGRRLDNRISRMRSLGDLRHTQLADQLRPYIADQTKSFVVRRVAIEIAEENEVREVQDAICHVALDATDDYLVRQQAAHALLCMGDDDVKAMIKPLAFGKAGEDPEDQLKGLALKALWPDQLTAQELFDNLIVPNDVRLYGHYMSFLRLDLVEGMHASHLPCALRWVQQQPSDRGAPFSFNDLIDSIMRSAYDHLQDSVILEEFARAALHRLREYEDVIPSGSKQRESLLFADDTKRRRLVETMLGMTMESDEKPGFEAHLLARLVTRRDVPWLIGLFREETRRKARDIVALLVACLFDPADSDQFETIYRLCQDNADLDDAMHSHLGPVYLESSEADTMRPRFLREEERKQAQSKEGRPSSFSQEGILNYLHDIEGGNSKKFSALSWCMIDAEGGPSHLYSAHTDLTILKSWNVSAEDTQRRIIRAALKYVTDCDPEATEWVGTSKINWSAWAGYQALMTLLRASPQSLTALDGPIWTKWAPALAACASGSQDPYAKALVAEAYARVPNAIIAHIMDQISYENSTNKDVFIVDSLAQCWDDRISEAILGKLDDPSLTAYSVDSLLTALSEHDREKGLTFAKSRLQIKLGALDRDQMLALVAAKVLMLNVPEEAWAVVWPILTQDRPFARQLMAILAPEADHGLERAYEVLTANELAAWYAWLASEYPLLEDVKHGQLSHAFSVHDIGERLLRHLQDRGTIESVKALQGLCTRLPDQAERLHWVLYAAKERTLVKTWIPWQPEEVLAVVQDHQKRLVQTGEQLLSVVIESLRRFELSLHGELPAIDDIWHLQKPLGNKNQKKELWIPVDEPVLSTRIARHLRGDLTERGIVIGREVQIRPGEFTDVHVDAVTQSAFTDRIDVVRVIIEVKGCWHDGLETDMESQLLNRYMAENNCDHGLYLVGWFYCDSWDQRDYRRTRPRKEIAGMPIEQAKDVFNRQAEYLTAQSGKIIRALVLDARRR